MKDGARFYVMRLAQRLGRREGRRIISIASYTFTLAAALAVARNMRERDERNTGWHSVGAYWIVSPGSRAHRRLIR